MCVADMVVTDGMKQETPVLAAVHGFGSWRVEGYHHFQLAG